MRLVIKFQRISLSFSMVVEHDRTVYLTQGVSCETQVHRIRHRSDIAN